MRVALISDVYFPRVNGVSTSIQSFRKGLARHGIECLLLAPRYGGEPDDPSIVRLPARPVPRDPEDRLMSFLTLVAQAELLRRERVRLVHLQTPFVAHYGGLRIARMLGVPTVLSYHTLFEEYLHHYLPLLPRWSTAALARALSRLQCRQVDRIIAPSEPMRERLLSYRVERPVTVLPTGIDVSAFARGERARFRQRHGIPEDRPVALYVGRVAHEKNIAFLLDAAEQARRFLPRLLLLIAGEGPALESLQQTVRRRRLGDAVRFLGYLERADSLPDCYAAADLFVFASRTETQGLVLLEAMASGLPVLAVACMGTRAILEEQRGCRIAADDAAGFATQMCALLSDRDLLHSLSLDARAEAGKWSEEVMAGRLAEIYRQLVKCPADHTTGSSDWKAPTREKPV